LFLAIFCTKAVAANWNASLSSKFQADNQISSKSSYAAEIWGHYNYYDVKNKLYGTLDFLTRASDLNHKTNNLYGYDSGYQIYQAYLKKDYSAIKSSIQAGRFERSDNLGFYLLDGLDVFYKDKKQQYSINIFAGIPTRIDHLKTEKGSSLLGFESNIHKKPNWQNSSLPFLIEVFDIRFGYQQFKNIDTAHRLNIGLNSEGKILTHFGDTFEARFLGTYRIDRNSFEDILMEAQVGFKKNLKIFSSYELYKPERFDNPTLRERFYNYYNFGNQALFRANADYQFKHNIKLTLGALLSNREIGATGYGLNTAIKLKYKPGETLMLSTDYIKLGKETIRSVWFGMKKVINSRLSISIDSIIRKEEKLLYGNNSVLGAELKSEYMLKNNLILSMDVNYISNSRLRNEYIASLKLTYYFDNFKAKG